MVINMIKIKVLLDFIKCSVSEKLVFYRHVMSNLLDNPAFPKPYISLAAVKTDVDHFEAAILAAKDGGQLFLPYMIVKKWLMTISVP